MGNNVILFKQKRLRDNNQKFSSKMMTGIIERSSSRLFKNNFV